ncbi:hypothetical protein ACOME3_008373 [Neoechinorhynchus agilis]
MNAARQYQVCIWRSNTNIRKIVVATNVAETSLTIAGISHVIDSGKVKQKIYKPGKKISVMMVVQCSQAQALQRAGRAGREGPKGRCYRMYSEKCYLEQMPGQTQPEIERCSLSGALLSLIAAGFSDPVNGLNYFTRPNEQALIGNVYS